MNESERKLLDKNIAMLDRQLAEKLYPRGRQHACDELDRIIAMFDHGSDIDRTPNSWWRNAR